MLGKLNKKHCSSFSDGLRELVKPLARVIRGEKSHSEYWSMSDPNENDGRH